MSLLKLQEKLIWQVQREYSQWEQHVRVWRSEVQSEISKLQEKVPDGKIKIDLVKENVDFERATFLTDDIDVTFVSDEWVLGKEVCENANLVAKYDYIDTNRKDLKDQIIIDNWYYGIAVEVIDMYDEDENQPVSQLVPPDTVIPDPKCQKGSYQRFVGLERRIPDWKLKGNNFDIGDMEVADFSTSYDMRMSDMSKDNTNFIYTNEGLADIYDHYTIFEGKKVLTTWVNDRSTLIRYVELKELTKAEKLNPMKVMYPVIYHRRRSKPFRWEGYRIKEEVGNSEDIVTQLANLEIAQARIATYWPDTFVDNNLGIDVASMQKKKPGGLITGVNVPQGSNVGNHIFQKQYAGTNQLAQQTKQDLLQRVQRNTGYTDITMGISPDGQQTKWEIQTLQNNANKILSWVSDSYMDWEKQFYTLWYRSYQENMSPKAKKTVALFDNGGLSQTLTKNEFISDGKVIIYLESAAQQAIKNERSVTKLLALAQSIIPNLKSEQSINTFLRTLVDKSSVDGLEWQDVIPLSYDERLATDRLRMINNNIEVISEPEAWEDFKTHIDIYEEALDTPAKKSLLEKYRNAYMTTSQKSLGGQTDWQGANMAMNLLAGQQNQNTNMQAGFWA